MRGKIITIPADEATPPSEIGVAGSAMILASLRGIVGGYIEIVPFFTTWQGEPCVVFCNENGKLDGLPVNRRATAIWWQLYPTSDHLVGDVAVVMGDEEFLREL